MTRRIAVTGGITAVIMAADAATDVAAGCSITVSFASSHWP